ncbi:ribosomal protein L7/L12 [Streptomyces olivochromogenes]|uniref:ribosomal protein L7/L12 n=1 Tax=Streptomyces olivochromogenes TaxID=1963 RepID=UPI0036D9A049
MPTDRPRVQLKRSEFQAIRIPGGWGDGGGTGVRIVLTGTGGRRMDVVQAVRSITGLSAWRSARLLESIPVVVVEDTWFGAAVDAVGHLKAVGADASLLCGWCERAIVPGTGPVDSGPGASPFLSSADCPVGRPRR